MKDSLFVRGEYEPGGEKYILRTSDGEMYMSLRRNSVFSVGRRRFIVKPVTARNGEQLLSVQRLPKRDDSSMKGDGKNGKVGRKERIFLLTPNLRGWWRKKGARFGVCKRVS